MFSLQGLEGLARRFSSLSGFGVPSSSSSSSSKKEDEEEGEEAKKPWAEQDTREACVRETLLAHGWPPTLINLLLQYMQVFLGQMRASLDRHKMVREVVYLGGTKLAVLEDMAEPLVWNWATKEQTLLSGAGRCQSLYMVGSRLVTVATNQTVRVFDSQTLEIIGERNDLRIWARLNESWLAVFSDRDRARRLWDGFSTEAMLLTSKKEHYWWRTDEDLAVLENNLLARLDREKNQLFVYDLKESKIRKGKGWTLRLSLSFEKDEEEERDQEDQEQEQEQEDQEGEQDDEEDEEEEEEEEEDQETERRSFKLFAADEGRKLVVYEKVWGEARVYQVSSTGLARTQTWHLLAEPAVCCGTTLVGTEGGEILLWCLLTGKMRRLDDVHHGQVSSLKSLHKGALLLSTAPAGLAHVWQPQTGQLLYTFRETGRITVILDLPVGIVLACTSLETRRSAVLVMV